MLAATLRGAGACRRVTAFASHARSRSAFHRIAALRRRAPSAVSVPTIASLPSQASSSSASSSAAAAAAAAATSTSSTTPTHRRFPPLAPGSVAPEEYAARLEEKVERVRSILADVLPPPRSGSGSCGGGSGGGEPSAPAPFPLEVFASPDRGFRLRAEFRVWHEGGDLYYVMFDTRDPSVKPPPKVRIDHFPVGPPMMNALMEETLAAMREDKGEGEDEDGEEEAAVEEEEEEEGELEGGATRRLRQLRQRRKKHPKSRGGPLRRKLFQANFHTTLSGECIVTLLYHRNLLSNGGDGGSGEGGGAAAWEAAAELLRRRLLRAAAPFGCRSVDVIGRSRGVALVVEKDHVQEELEVEFGGRKKGERGDEDGEGAEEPSSSSSSSSRHSPPPPRRALRYRQTEGSFSQPNGRVCESMLGWAWKAALGSIESEGGGVGTLQRRWRRDDDLLELYCGNGNFTAALAPAFRRAVATEVSRSGVASAVINLEENGGKEDDVVVARADADRVAAALAALDNKRGEEGGEEEGGAADEAAAESAVEAGGDGDVFDGVVPTSLGGSADLSTYDLRTLFVDPPRAGVGPVTRRVLSRFDRVLYVSCNPESLAADVAALVNGERNDKKNDDGPGGQEQQNGKGTHEVTAAAVFDQFPYTDHIECGLLLKRRKREKK